MTDHMSNTVTPRLTLRPLGDNDASAIVEGIGHYDVSKWLTVVPHPYTMEDARQFLGHAKNKPHYWALTRQGRLIGIMSADNEFGYWIGPDHWGHGFASEAGVAVIDRWFSDPANTTLRSSHFTGNAPSANVLCKLGFEYVGEHRPFSQARGHEVPGFTMELNRETWARRRDLPYLSTARTQTRPMTVDDVPDLVRIAGTYDCASNTGSIRSPWSRQAASQWVAARMWTGQPGFCLALCDRQGKLIGLTGCSPIGEDGTVSIMYLLCKDLWGRGVATEAATALVAALFRCFDLPAITADHFVDNPASGVILRRLGFDYLGQNTGSSLARLEPAPISLYRLDRSTFEARL